jgi:hypothetical protein
MDNNIVTRAELEDIAEKAAQKAMTHFFMFLDVDVGDKDSIRRLRDDLTFLSNQREGSIMMKQTVKKSALYLMSAAIIGLTYFLWDVFKDGFLLWLNKV